MCVNVNEIYYPIHMQLNTSGCECLPNDCDKANKTLEFLNQSTEHCFFEGNVPINSVAHKIRGDAHHLHNLLKYLESEIQDEQVFENHDDMECSFEI